MIAILTLMTVLTLSLVIVRVATIALTLTGLSRELARFQARSAFTGTGFTTSESEKVVAHPIRELRELRLNQEGILILGIERHGGDYVGAPRGLTKLHAGDTLLVYGRGRAISELDQRSAGAAGSRAHVESVAWQASMEREGREADAL